MTLSAALVVTTTATEPGKLLAARLRALLDAGWDARLLCKGEQWMQEPALRDPALGDRVELATGGDRYMPPRSLLRRPADLARYLGASGEAGPFDERLLELRPDLIHFHSGWACWKGMRLKRLLGCRTVVSFRADGQDLRVPNPDVLWEADLLLFPAAEALERAAARGCPRERAEVLPAPLWDAGPSMDGRRPAPGALRILSAAPLTWEQGLEHSVHAVRLLLDMGVPCRYRIVGEGDHLLAVAFARHQLDLTEYVELERDGGDGLVEELRTADVFVDPAVTGTTSMTPLVIAQGRGVPFVATQRPGLPDDAGIAVPRRNARAIADALATLAADPDLRARMGEAGQALIGWYPTLTDHVHRLEELYARVLAD